MTGSIVNFALYFVTCLVFWAAAMRVYVAITPYREFAMVAEGNKAAAYSLSGTALGLALPLASLAVHAASLADLAAWALVGLITQLAFWWVLARFVFRDLNGALQADRQSVGMVLGALSAIVGLLDAACLTY